MSNIEICRKPDTAPQECEAADTRPRGYFCLSGAWDELMWSAERHDRKALCRADSCLDMQPVKILQGLAYMTERMSHIPEDEIDHKQLKSSMLAVSEVTSLIASMLVLQNTSYTDSVCERMGVQA